MDSLVPIAAFCGFLGVLFGAVGAHMLAGKLSEIEHQWWHTAVFYHLVHTLLLLIVAFWAKRNPSKWLNYCAVSVFLGIIFFSGSLYLLALTQFHLWVYFTPVGGLGFILGWIFLSLSHRDIQKHHG